MSDVKLILDTLYKLKEEENTNGCVDTISVNILLDMIMYNDLNISNKEYTYLNDALAMYSDNALTNIDRYYEKFKDITV